MIRIFAAGTCSDILIVAAKANSFREKVGITFYTRHFVYQKPINDIIQSLKFADKQSGCIVHTDPAGTAKEEAEKYGPDGIYVTNSLRDRWNTPRFNFEIPVSNIDVPQKDYICLQMEAGFSKRTISTKLLRTIKEPFSQHIIVLGHTHIQVDDKVATNEDNRSGRTFSVLDSFALIKNSIGFIGPNGLLSYYAALNNIPSIINCSRDDILRTKLLRRHQDNVVEINQGDILHRLSVDQLNRFIVMINQR